MTDRRDAVPVPSPNPDRQRGVLVVLCGPSGVGKGTIVRRLLALLPTARLSVSATTRPPRPGETDGVQYHFVSPEEFDRLLAAGDLLEWAAYAGNRYGTPRSAVEHQLRDGHDVVLEIEVQGALQIRERVEEALHIFLTPPSFEELERRLVGRGTEDAATRAVRLEAARGEMAHRHTFDHVVVNDDVDRATNEIIDLIGAERGNVPDLT